MRGGRPVEKSRHFGSQICRVLCRENVSAWAGSAKGFGTVQEHDASGVYCTGEDTPPSSTSVEELREDRIEVFPAHAREKAQAEGGM